MAHESKNSSTVIIVAIIGVIGTIIGAIITISGNYNVEKMRQEAELTQIALGSQSTQIVISTIQVATEELQAQNTSPRVTNCPSPSSYAIDVQTLKPGISISGPATVHPYDGSAELAQVLGLGWIANWGINVPSGTTIQIPQSVILLNGRQYTPDGYIDVYLDDARMEAAQQCWLINNP